GEGRGKRRTAREDSAPPASLPDIAPPDLAMRNWAAKLALSAGVSLAVYPLLFLFTDLVGLHLGALYAWLPPIIGILVILWRNRARLNVNTLKRFRIPLPSAADVCLIIVLALVFAVRFWVIRTLDAPMWGDSYQHTMIAQLIVDNGGLFDSWEPYAELSTLTYHFGFHTIVAIFGWLTRIPTHLATLWVGQILNGLAVLSLYPLATRIGKSRWAGTAAVAIAGLLSPMPMYYTNWGRYTQLAGQVILPAILYIVIIIVNTKTANWKLRGLSWITLGGLALTHYRVLIFVILFFPLLIFINARKNRISKTIVEAAWIGIGAGLLFLPWFMHVFAGTILDVLNAQLSTPAKDVSQFTQQYNSIGNLLSYLPMAIWLLLPIAIGWGLWKRNREHVLLSLWSFMILLAANPNWLRFPGSGALSNFAVVIAAYLPAGIILGAASGWIARDLVKNNRIWKNVLLTTVVCAISLWGARQRLYDIHPDQHALVTRPDTLAASWIRDNVPKEARFLVNSFFAYGDSLIAGADGGWWLPLLTGRDTTLPPLPYGSEQGLRPNYRLWVNELTQTWTRNGITHPDTLEMLSQRGITHIYIGQQQGRVNYDGPHVLQAEQMLADPHFYLVYHQDRVWIFEIIQ
ncbi:MAG: hypothetical protein KJ638_06380, partial [Chloroflexi bacterium]|nr:hypothetical protein [Chloroflexota bacterium]